MKKLMKFLFFFVLIIVLLVGGTIAILFFTISDKTDDAPTDLYDESINANGQLAKVIDHSLSVTDEINLTLSEEDINLLIFSIIRESVNIDYYNNGCTTDSCKYIQTVELDSEFLIVGGKKVLVKNAYSSLKDNSLTFFITLDVLGVKTNLNFGFIMEETDGVYKVTLNKFGLGGLNLMSGIGKLLLKPILSMAGISEESINQNIDEDNIPVDFNIKDFSFTFNKSDLGEILFGLMGPEDENNQEILGEFITILTSSDNDILDIGFFKVNEIDTFGLKLNLTELKYDQTVDGVPTLRVDYSTYQTNMSLLLSGGLSREDFDVASKYILYGYSKLDELEKDVINTNDFSSVGINDKTSYLGLVHTNVNDLNEYVSNKLYSELTDISDSNINVKIEESIINQIIFNNDLVGVGYNSFYQINDEYKVIYSGIEAVWIDIVDNELGFKLLFNLNGTSMCLFTSFNNNTPNTAKIEAEFDELRIGSIQFSDDFKNTIINILKDSLNSSSIEIITIGDNNIIIDTNEFIDELEGEGSFADLINILKDEDMISLNLVGTSLTADGTISFSIDLEKLEVEDLSTALSQVSNPFDVDTFIQNKTQTLIINNLSSPDEMKMTFTEKEFSRLIYQETNGYQGFSNTTTLEDGTTEFTYQVTGIIIEFTPEIVRIKFVLEVNGLETMVILDGDVLSSLDEDQVIIDLKDTILLGDITTSSDFILDMLGDNMNNLSVIEYDAVEKNLILTSVAFEQFIAVGGDSSPLTVEKIRVINKAIEIVVNHSDPTLGAMIDDASSAIESVLGDDFLDTNLFDTTDPEQAAAVTELNDILSEISTIISDPVQELTSEETDQLIEAMNNLSDENQEELLNQIENESSSQDLLDLYSALFVN